jgi:flavin reductase (DIM6/NTAB) family NADH-FMN oxidoreductase RutF
MSARRLRSLPLAKVYRLIEPGPVVLMTTVRAGRANVMPMTWHTMLEFEPPLIGCVISERNFSHATLKATRQYVLAIPTVELAKQVVRCGNCSGRDTDKSALTGLSALPAKTVAAPLIAECHANLECRVADTARYGMVVLEVLQAWVDAACKNPRTLHHRGYGSFMVAGETIRLPSRMA